MFGKRVIAVIICLLICTSCLFIGVGCSDGSFTVRFEAGADDAELYYGEQVQKVKSSSEIEEPIFIRPGYNFVGWNKSISRIESSTTISAQWKKYSFEVTFNANGGRDEAGNKVVVLEVDSAVELMEKAPKFVKKGYALSWSVDLGNIQGTCSVDAVWTMEDYSLIFKDINGNDFANNTLIARYDQTIGDLSVKAPAIQGKRFAYWVDESELPLDKGSVWEKTEGGEFYPRYANADDYIITYDINGGQRANRAYSYNASLGEDACVLVDPIRIGYAFMGWKINDGQTAYLSEQITINDFKVNGQYADVTLTAVWESRPYYIDFETDGGVLSTQNLKPVEYGKVIGELPTADKDGYVFTGWYYNGDIVKETDLWLIPQDTTLTAGYKAIYKIKFSLDATVSTDGAVLRCKVLRWGSLIDNGQTDFESVIIEIKEGQSLYSAIGFDKMPVVDPIEEQTVNDYAFGNEWLWIDTQGKKHIVYCSTIFSSQNFEGVLGGQTITLVPYCKTTWTPRY